MMKLWICYHDMSIINCDIMLGGYYEELNVFPRYILWLCYQEIFPRDVGFVMKGLSHQKTYEICICYMRSWTPKTYTMNWCLINTLTHIKKGIYLSTRGYAWGLSSQGRFPRCSNHMETTMLSSIKKVSSNNLHIS